MVEDEIDLQEPELAALARGWPEIYDMLRNDPHGLVVWTAPGGELRRELLHHGGDAAPAAVAEAAVRRTLGVCARTAASRLRAWCWWPSTGAVLAHVDLADAPKGLCDRLFCALRLQLAEPFVWAPGRLPVTGRVPVAVVVMPASHLGGDAQEFLASLPNAPSAEQPAGQDCCLKLLAQP